jgi:hypothetical protein
LPSAPRGAEQTAADQDEGRDPPERQLPDHVGAEVEETRRAVADAAWLERLASA